MKPLTTRDIQTLDDAIRASDYFRTHDHKDGWIQAIDAGGTNGSHHSYTLHKLAKRGLIEMMKLGGKREKGSCRYRRNDTGVTFLTNLRIKT